MTMTAPSQNQHECATIDSRDRTFWMAIRQALIMALGAIEDYLGLERSIVPRHKRRQDIGP
jgi:hypothetical protein